MSAPARNRLVDADNPFDNIRGWLLLHGRDRRQAREEMSLLAGDLRSLTSAPGGEGKLYDACAGVELSAGARNLAKIVGSMTIIAPPSGRS